MSASPKGGGYSPAAAEHSPAAAGHSPAAAGYSPAAAGHSPAASASPSARGPSAPTPKGESESVKVAVRVRPFNEREQASSQISVVRMNMSRKLVMITPPSASSGSATGGAAAHNNTATFEFDHVFWSMSEPDVEGNPPATQADVYNQIGKPLVAHAINGFNSCLFAYGQTGSGKTHSMMGGASIVNEERGVIPRLAQDLFIDKAAHETRTGSKWTVEFGYVEVYNEKVSDLLAPRKDKNDVIIELREDPKKGQVFLQGQTLIKVNSCEEIMDLIKQGNEARHVAATKMNARSSRSHAIVQITLTERRTIKLVTGQSVEGNGVQSRLNLVDLAGSERVAQSQVVGEQFNEAKFINLSLTTLGRVIDMLADMAKNENSKWTKPPYRESKLTFLLKDSLGGNSKTFMIAAVSPSDMNYDESLGTLRYASRARQIVNTAKVNEDPQSRKIREMEQQMEEMRRAMQSQGGDPEFVAQLQEKLKQMENETSQRAQEMETLRLQKEQAEKQAQMLRATQEDKDRLQREADELARKVSESQARQREHQQEMERLKDEHLRREQEIREKLESRENDIARMERQLSEMKGAAESLNKTMEELEEERRSKDRALDQLAQKQQALQDLLATTQEASEHRAQLQAQNQSLLTEIAEKRAQQEQMAKLSDELTRIKEQHDRGEAEVQRLRMKFETHMFETDEINSRRFLIDAHTEQYNDIHVAQLRQLYAHIDMLEDVRENYASVAAARGLDLETIESLQDEVDQKAARIRQLETEKQQQEQIHNEALRESHQALDKSATETAALRIEVDSLKLALDGSSTQLAALTAANDRLQEAKRAVEAQLAELQAASSATAGEQTATIEKLGGELAALQEAKRAVEAQLAELQAASSATAGEQTATIEKLGGELAELQAAGECAAQEVKQLRLRLSAAKEELQRSNTSKAALKVRLETSRKQCEALHVQIGRCPSCSSIAASQPRPEYSTTKRLIALMAARGSSKQSS